MLVKRRYSVIQNLYVQYGCGYSAPEKWRNFDASPTLFFERLPIIGKFYTRNKMRFPKNVEYGDIVIGIPIQYNSCKAVYCSHVLEHLSLEDCLIAFKNTYNILQKDGVFRLVLPDLQYSINKYTNDPSSNAALVFLKETSHGKEKRNRGIKGFILEWFGNSNHLWMWDLKSIKNELINIGFIDIEKVTYNDSTDQMFKEVEDKERWENCLGVECRKA